MNKLLAVLVALALASVAIGGPTTADPNTYIYTHDPDGIPDNGDEVDYEWAYGFDSTKYINGYTGYSRYAMEIARDPVKLTTGPYAGGYEYLFDLYIFDGYGTTGTTYEIGGLDNSKIMNKETDPLIGCSTNSPGRPMQIWSHKATENEAQCEEIQAPSYDDGAGGWTDSGLDYGWTHTENPHSYDEYCQTAIYYWGIQYNYFIALDLLNEGEDLSYDYTNVTDAVADQIVLSRYWQGVSSGATGLIFTLRIVYEDPIIPTYMGGDDDLWWSFASYGEGTRYDVLGEYDVFSVPGDYDGDQDIDADDVDILCANIGETDPALLETMDLDDDGDIDVDDQLIHITTLLEYDLNGDDIADGQGTFRADFNTDGAVDLADLTILRTNSGLTGQGFADGDTNCDGTVDLADLTTLRGLSGSSVSGVPEPVTIGLLGLGTVALLRRRSR